MPQVTFDTYAYTDDQAAVWEIKLDNITASLTGAVAVAKDSLPRWPYKSKHLRHVRGVDLTDSYARKVVCPQLSTSLYSSSAAQWTDQFGNTIIRTGRFGESKPGI